ncbi:hypothetical protein AB0F72_08900 [Actinoplanes sp. NPDC023936]|uniref:hypothetical protein n=1 Tax=Actinoplanes sp. NPDC023936 TaxID=3154910 RepID=UPI0034024F5B
MERETLNKETQRLIAEGYEVVCDYGDTEDGFVFDPVGQKEARQLFARAAFAAAYMGVSTDELLAEMTEAKSTVAKLEKSYWKTVDTIMKAPWPGGPPDTSRYSTKVVRRLSDLAPKQPHDYPHGSGSFRVTSKVHRKD